MENLVLQHDVISLSREVLLPSGTRLDLRTCA
jgi:hypothetical protein